MTNETRFDVFRTFVVLEGGAFTDVTGASIEVWSDKGIDKSERTGRSANDENISECISLYDVVQFYLKHHGKFPDFDGFKE